MAKSQNRQTAPTAASEDAVMDDAPPSHQDDQHADDMEGSVAVEDEDEEAEETQAQRVRIVCAEPSMLSAL
jgi:hypothetical protein